MVVLKEEQHFIGKKIKLVMQMKGGDEKETKKVVVGPTRPLIACVVATLHYAC